MIRKFKHSIRFKLTMLLMVMMAVTVFMSLLITQLCVKKYFLFNLRYRMQTAYEEVNRVFNLPGIDEEDLKSLLARLAADGELNMLVIDTESGLVYTNINQKSKMWDSMQSLANLFREGTDEDNVTEIIGESGKGFYTFHRNYDTKVGSEFYDLVGVLDSGNLVAIRSSAIRFNESVNATMHLYLYVGIFSVLVGCVAMFFASSSYVKPIREMALVAKRMAQMDFDVQVTSRSADEIGDLGNSINSMSRELENTISELKTANAKLTKDIEEKTQVDEMRKEFLSHVSHELKTPIALIQGYAEGLKENVSDDPESREFYCEVIMDEAERMNSMVKKLMALNELEFGTDKISFERFDIIEMMNNINHSMDIMIQQKELKLDFPYVEPVFVWGDEFLMEEVYGNYLSNAIHYAVTGGNVQVTLTEDDTHLRVSVFNEGSQIPEDELDKVWIKFYKVDKARTREYGGSGIGLSIVAATMKLHNQKFGVYNQENGVVFYFELEKVKPWCRNENGC